MKELVSASVVTAVIAVATVLIVPNLDFAGGEEVAADGGFAFPGQQTPTEGEAVGGAALGQQLVGQLGCLGCHNTTADDGVGPGWGGLFGSTETLADGSTVEVDEEYLRESILDPNAKIVEGFQPNIMPPFEGRVSDEELDAIVEYIRTLQ